MKSATLYLMRGLSRAVRDLSLRVIVTIHTSVRASRAARCGSRNDRFIYGSFTRMRARHARFLELNGAWERTSRLLSKCLLDSLKGVLPGEESNFRQSARVIFPREKASKEIKMLFRPIKVKVDLWNKLDSFDTKLSKPCTCNIYLSLEKSNKYFQTRSWVIAGMYTSYLTIFRSITGCCANFRLLPFPQLEQIAFTAVILLT